MTYNELREKIRERIDGHCRFTNCSDCKYIGDECAYFMKQKLRDNIFSTEINRSVQSWKDWTDKNILE